MKEDLQKKIVDYIQTGGSDFVIESFKDDISLKLSCYSDLVLLAEIIRRNGIDEAPRITKRQGEWCEVLVAAGKDETVSICFPDEAIEAICKHEIKESESIYPLNDGVNDCR